MAAFAVGGGVALAIALAGPASADEVVAQDADVVNAGAAVANSGGNVAVGNASDNEATSDQTAHGGLVAGNAASTSNSSDGTASITTGSATATGNESNTVVAQSTEGDDGGATVASQDADVVNAGVGVANSGGNVAVGNASDNTATSNQKAKGGLAGGNLANTSNHSDGSASITTGAATATGNRSSTWVVQSVSTGDGGGVAVVSQDADVLNAGLGVANSGLNLAIGNTSDNTATSNQKAKGWLWGFNAASTSNHSDGSASIKTGAATATGNSSNTGIVQSVSSDPCGLAVVSQSASVPNLGLGIANTGLNGALANNANDSATTTQLAWGLLAWNLASTSNNSDGWASIVTGSSWAVGNSSNTWVVQKA